MLAEQLAVAVASAPTFAAIDNLARITWRGLAEGHIEEQVAGALGNALEARRVAIRSLIAVSPPKRASAFPGVRKRQSSPNKLMSIRRRRQIAASGVMPGKLACDFTVGQVAALSVIAREVKKRGRCALPIDAIAAIAGTCRTVVQEALRRARELRLVAVIERRRPGRPSGTNIISIISPEWQSWLRLGRGGGFGKKSPTNTNSYYPQAETGNAWHSRSVPVVSGLKRPEEALEKGREGKPRLGALE